MAVVGTVISAVLTSVILGFLAWLSGLQDLKEKVAGMDKALNVTKMQLQIDDLERKVNAIDKGAAPAAQPTPQPKSVNTK
jgi:hypothetical protein